MNNKIHLTNIQRFCLHDGPGIRTTVFLKGCSLCCPWCSNPENLLPQPQNYIKDGVSRTYGRYYTSDDLVKECLKDKIFYTGELVNPKLWNITNAEDIDKLPGGVTFSGGEPLLQMEALVPVCSALHKFDIHIAAETCLFVPQSNLTFALDYIDFFYCDIKILNPNRCMSVEQGRISIYLENFNTLMKSGKPIVIRIPVIGTYTDIAENRLAVHELISKYRDSILKIELIKEHNLGESKYKSLNLKFEYHGVKDSLMEQYKDELSKFGILTEICKL